MKNPPSRDSLADYYSSNDQYRRAHLTAEEAHHINEQVRFVAAGVRQGSTHHLEIGPDNGTFLQLLAMQVSGELFFEEFNEEAVTSLTARHMQNAFAHPGLHFDTITLRHVFEHIVDPIQFLRAQRDRLTNGGVLFIEVPDYSAVADAESDIFQFEHVNYFSITALQHLARRAGLRIERVEFARTPGYSTTPNRVVRVLLRKARVIDDGRSIDAWERLLYASDDDIRRLATKLRQNSGHRIAIYGAGTLTMKLLAAVSDDVILSRIYDADPKKTGWTLLGTDVQPAATVDHNDFDLIVLTIVGYETEVRRFLRESDVPDNKIVNIQEFVVDGNS